MKKKTVKTLSVSERNSLDRETYIKIETEFHDNYSEILDWDEPVSENYSYDREDKLYGKEVEDCFVKMLGDVKGKRILDIGSGHGNTALKLAQRGGIVTSIDISPRLIEGCRYRAKKHSLPIEFMVMDACDLSFPDNSFDLVVGFRTIHHLPDIGKFYKDAHRCLEKGGFLLLVEPQKHNPFVELGRKFIKNSDDSRTPTEHPLVPSDIRLLKKVFGNVERKEFEFLSSACLALKMVKLKVLYSILLKPAMILDRALRPIPFLRPLYWQVVLKSYK